jgi:HAD superfamily hydrolase (TIGR01509 family)
MTHGALRHQWPNRIRAIIFDVDDTLVDTRGNTLQIMREILGREIPKSWYRANIGIPNGPLNPSDWNGLLSDIGHTPSLTREEFNRAVGAAKMRQTPKLIPGVETVVRNLAEKSIRLAIATGAARAGFAARRYNEPFFFGHFTTVVTANDVARQKPDPEPFLKAAENLGVLPMNTLVVDDRTDCLEQAQRVGFATAHFVSESREGPAEFNIVFRKWTEFESAFAALGVDGA